MEYLFNTFIESIKLLWLTDTDVWKAVFISLKVTLTALFICSIIGIPAGYLLATRVFTGREIIITIFNTLLSLPTVVIGLIVYAFICNRGPLGSLNLLFTQKAMIIGEVILGLPLIISLSNSAIQLIDKRAIETAVTLGAGSFRTAATVIVEGKYAIVAVIATTFGRLIGEVGIVLMLGGNINGLTRNITTAIALETSKGEFAFGLALGIILILVALIVNILLRFLQGKTK